MKKFQAIILSIAFFTAQILPAAQTAESFHLAPPMIDLKTVDLKEYPEATKYLSMNITLDDINLDMFRDYDYRTREYIPSPVIAFYLGLMWAKMGLERAEEFNHLSRTVLIARDCRKIDPSILDAIQTAFRYCGLNVVFLSEKGPNAVSDYS